MTDETQKNNERRCLRLKFSTPLEVLKSVKDRIKCESCDRKRMYFCYDCRLFVKGVDELAPRIQLPVKIDVIKHANEKNSKSTAIHAYLTAPDQVRIFDKFEDVPFYSLPNDSPEGENTVVVYPSKNSVSIKSVVAEKGPIKKFVFLDSTWNTIGRLRNLPQLKNLTFVHLKGYKTDYWRYQKGYCDEYLATIEAMYFAIREHADALGEQSYGGEFDDLLFWFYHFRQMVQPEIFTYYRTDQKNTT